MLEIKRLYLNSLSLHKRDIKPPDRFMYPKGKFTYYCFLQVVMKIFPVKRAF